LEFIGKSCGASNERLRLKEIAWLESTEKNAKLDKEKTDLSEIVKNRDKTLQQLNTDIFQLKKTNEHISKELEQLKRPVIVQSPPIPKIIETRIEQFIVRDDGTALDTKTGLTWCRYSIGQSWSNGKVAGEAVTMTWDEAMKVADSFNKHDACGSFRDWRLPKLNELASLVDKRYKPTINPVVFRNTPTDKFWSSISHNNAFAQSIDFSNGAYSTCRKQALPNNVRLVRG
jgi:hypothetical protein